MKKYLAALAVLLCAGGATAASAGIGADASVAHADGQTGGEFGIGYSWSMQGFSLTPGVGLFAADGDTRAYGRIEAAYQIPSFVKLGAGVRIDSDHTRPYGTVALPLVSRLAVKANAGPHYYTIGLALGY